jgi:hypothetical protein
VASCGGGGLTLTEYAAEIESIVSDMNREVDAASVEIEAGGATPAQVQLAFERRGAARARFVDELSTLEPPDQAEELHAASSSIVARLRDAELAMAARAATTPGMDATAIWQSPEFRALEDIDQEAIAFCELAQSAFDDTAEREAFRGSSWMPPELKEVVDVAFRCGSEEREGG